MSRDWGEVNTARWVSGWGRVVLASDFLEAIAEIEQLRQEKAELENQLDVVSTTVDQYVPSYYELRKEKTELVEVLKKLVPPANESGYWCPTCKEVVNGIQVTYSEHHEACGTYLGDCQPEDWGEEARNLLAKHERSDTE